MACHWGSNDNLSRKLTTKLSCFGANIFLAKRTAEVLVRIGIVATVTVGDMAALSHLTHRDMGNVTMMSGTSLTM
ncbi:hypothetical protein [Shewanella sp.]|uniref:hypothetical protein n=1 Tax=Shewanella sp. TaxID=50422 RepID=UPI0026110751|nr:hypothetical protein [Shewanella sp.]